MLYVGKPAAARQENNNDITIQRPQSIYIPMRYL
jgi:hypothetical protein